MTDTRLPESLEAEALERIKFLGEMGPDAWEARGIEMVRWLFARLSQMGPGFDKRSIQLAFSKHVMAHPKQPQEPAWMWECGAKAQFEQTQAQVGLAKASCFEKLAAREQECNGYKDEIERLKRELAEKKEAYEFLWKMRIQDKQERK